MKPTKQPSHNGKNVEKVFQLFGGPSRLARLLALPTSTVGYWSQTGHIPTQHQPRILALAKAQNIPITAEDLIGVPVVPSRVGEKVHGPEIVRFRESPAPIPVATVEKGKFMKDLLELSEDQLVLCFIGVGSAFAKYNDQTSLLIVKNRKSILVDVGTTIPQALHRNGMDVTGFDYYHLTHAHSDHIGGLEEMLLKHRYILGKKAKIIITPRFQQTLWEHSLKGGSEVNELGLLKFSDLAETVEPSWVKNQPRETFQINVEGIHLTIFRTIHTPGDVQQWEKAFWSTGLVVDGKVLFSADTRFDPSLFTDIDLSRIDTIYHDCQLFSPGKVHATYDELNTLPDAIKAKMFLTHYGDTYDKFDPQKDGFAGFAKPFTPYCWVSE